MMVKRVYCVGLTGGIASGKTAASTRFAQLGIEIIDADTIAHTLTQKNQAAYHAIVKHFGEGILCESGEINRSQLASLIFLQPESKAWLENYLHPLIRNAIAHARTKVNSPYCIIVIPLLAETNHPWALDRICVVDCSVDLQLHRLTTQRHLNHEHAQRMLSAQATRKNRLAIADDMIDNHSTLHALDSQISALHTRYIQYAACKKP